MTEIATIPWHPADEALELLALNRECEIKALDLERFEEHVLICPQCVAKAEIFQNFRRFLSPSRDNQFIR